MSKKKKRKHAIRTTHHVRNIILELSGIAAAVVLWRMKGFHDILLHLGSFGYFGAFFTGMLFVSTITAPIGTLMLLILAEKYSLVEIGLFAGAGAVVGDTLIFHYVKGGLAYDLKDLYKRFGGSHLTHIFHTKYFRWTLPVLGALIIASPLPDELGVSLLGISKMKPLQFLLISFTMNVLGIFLIISSSAFIKP